MVDGRKPLTSLELQTILDVNRKSIEIYAECEQQQSEILEELGDLKEEGKLVHKKMEEIDKNLFRLVVLLSTLTGSSLIALIAAAIKYIILNH